jgi:hypothetical protein
MKGERYIEINQDGYSYRGMMTQCELLREANKRHLLADNVTIGGLVIYGWDEIDMMWALAEHKNSSIKFS